jgi:hypothetical protein
LYNFCASTKYIESHIFYWKYIKSEKKQKFSALDFDIFPTPAAPPILYPKAIKSERGADVKELCHSNGNKSAGDLRGTTNKLFSVNFI